MTVRTERRLNSLVISVVPAATNEAANAGRADRTGRVTPSRGKLAASAPRNTPQNRIETRAAKTGTRSSQRPLQRPGRATMDRRRRAAPNKQPSPVSSRKPASTSTRKANRWSIGSGPERGCADAETFALRARRRARPDRGTSRHGARTSCTIIRKAVAKRMPAEADAELFSWMLAVGSDRSPTRQPPSCTCDRCVVRHGT